MSWKIVKDKTEDYWMEASFYDGSGVYEGDHLQQYPVSRAICKWDGCIHYYQCQTLEDPHEHTNDCDYLHIDDLEAFIKEMQQLQELALDFYKDKPNGNQYYK